MDFNAVSQIFTILASLGTLIIAFVTVATFIRQLRKDQDDEE